MRYMEHFLNQAIVLHLSMFWVAMPVFGGGYHSNDKMYITIIEG